MIKPYSKESGRIPKEKKKRKQKTEKQKLQNKGDKLYQEIGRLSNSKCLICGGEYSCLHHYFPKSTSTPLRYDFDNGIPICARCHCKIHSNPSPETNNDINHIKGEEWLQELTWKKQNTSVKSDIMWYKANIERMEEILKALKKYKAITLKND